MTAKLFKVITEVDTHVRYTLSWKFYSGGNGLDGTIGKTVEAKVALFASLDAAKREYNKQRNDIRNKEFELLREEYIDLPGL